MRSGQARALFLLDTNVLIHDSTSIFRFEEHDVFLALRVLEELDRVKQGASEVANSAREASRVLADLVADADLSQIKSGIDLPGTDQRPGGGLFFQTEILTSDKNARLSLDIADNEILQVALALVEKGHYDRVVLVSKDINLRIKAAVLGIVAEDYHSDRVLDDVDLLYRGLAPLPEDFWSEHGARLAAGHDGDRTIYRSSERWLDEYFPNQGLYESTQDGSDGLFLVRKIGGRTAQLERLPNHGQSKHSVWGIHSRNLEQNFALNLLLDPEIHFVSLLGAAGSGKTLLALAAGLDQVLDHRIYREILMTRATVSVGEDIGFLPGTEEEKMTPWMGALLDNLEVLTESGEGGSWGRAVTQDLLRQRIKIRAMNFMRGRTFHGKYLIIDEAQNLTAKQMKTLVTRAGPGTKVVCIGNIAQIDTPYLSETTSGLTFIIDRFKKWSRSGHVTLLRGERSELADFASENL